VDKTQSAHDPFAERIITQFGDHDPSFITDNDVFYAAGAIDKNGDLTAEFAGKFDETGSQFMGAEFSNRYPPAIQALQRLDLTGF
jgi:hypothetical protein